MYVYVCVFYLILCLGVRMYCVCVCVFQMYLEITRSGAFVSSLKLMLDSELLHPE